MERAGRDRAVDVAVHHLDDAEPRQRARRAAACAPASARRGLVVSEVGAVIGAHVGPGLLAVVVAPR